MRAQNRNHQAARSNVWNQGRPPFHLHYARFNLPFVLITLVMAGLSGCTGNTSTQSGALAAGVLSTSPSSMNFGNVQVGGSSSLTAMLINTGNSNITISSVTVTGTGYTAGSIDSGAVLKRNETAGVTVIFAPTSVASDNGTLSIISTATNSPTTIALSGIGTPPSAPNKKWVTGYYADWQENAYPINRIDFTALTHIVLAHWLTNSNGTLQSAGWDSMASSVTQPAHAAGIKVIMMLGGSDDVNFAAAANSTNRSALVNSILAKVSSLGLDGVDLDWEVGVNPTNFIALASVLRSAQPSLIITAPLDPSVQPNSLAAGLAPYCDQLNMTTYGGGNTSTGWVSWYFSALAGDGPNHPSSVNLFVNNWLGAGVPAAKIGIGIGFYARGWTAPVTGTLQTIGNATVPIGELPYGWSANNGGGVLSWFYNLSGTTYTYDTGLPQQPSISISNGLAPLGWSGAPITWVTYEDEASVAAKGNYVQQNNLGGVIIWTLGEGATDPTTGRNPLLDSVKRYVLQLGPAPMPLLATTEAEVAGPTTITLTGLPSNLRQINVSWWNGTSGVAWDDTTDPGYPTYGQPAEYYIEASANGTTWVQLNHITGEHYTGRQFVFDWTGTGYTQVRMRIVSMVGSNAGRDTFTVHNAASNSSDAYLLLGDSITANCWGAATNTFPSEQFGAQINAIRPDRYPISTEGGQAGFLSSGPLDTTTYGVPEIQQWLSDMPAVKFVGLSFGTNDSNEGVAASTYCDNMQSLVQHVIAAGKTPIIPTIVASPSSAVQANAPAMNACLARLEKNYPSIIVGPDLWTVFNGHSVADGWFSDNLHPSLTTGCTAFQNAWINTMISAVYPQ